MIVIFRVHLYKKIPEHRVPILIRKCLEQRISILINEVFLKFCSEVYSAFFKLNEKTIIFLTEISPWNYLQPVQLWK